MGSGRGSRTGPSAPTDLDPGSSHKGSAGARTDRDDRQAPWAVVVFVAYLAVALVLIVGKLGRYHWFVADDWDFLANRHVSSLHDLLRPHNEHWTTVPVVYYRAMWQVFGIRSYLPWQVVSVTVHLTLAWLLRVVMRRAGVGPWMATIAAGILVLFGSGQQNIVSAFQVSFTGAMVLGVGQLLLTDHGRRGARRDRSEAVDRPDGIDLVGVLLGVLAVMTSAIGVPMVIAAGFGALLRRGWRVALLNWSPLVLYVIWYAAYRPRSTTAVLGTPSAWQMLKWMASGLTQTAQAVGYFEVVAVALTLVLVIGLVLAWKPLSLAQFRRTAWGPAALLVALGAFWSVNSFGRAILGTADATQSRYLYVSAALLLPALAVAADALSRRAVWLAWAMPILLLIGIPPNINDFTHEYIPPAIFTSSRQLVVGLATSPLAIKAPHNLRPDPSTFGLGNTTIGWLRNAQAEGKLPTLSKIPLAVSSQFPVRLGLLEDHRATPPMVCRARRQPLTVKARRGDVFSLRSAVNVSTVADGRVTSAPVEFNPGDPIAGHTLTVTRSGLDLRFSPVFGPYTVCAPAGRLPG